MKLYITESDIRKLVLNTLTEAALSIDDVYNKYYQSVDRDVFNAAVAADPTSYNQGKVVKVGNFVKWILKLYTNGSWKEGDSYETRDLLTKFIKYKSKLPIEKRDINRYNSISELYSLMQTLEGKGVKTQSDVKRDGAEVVYEDAEWKIIIPHTKEASCIYGAHTRWCTAGRGDNMFEYYNDKGPLYININKQTGEKYQFHFESEQFMNAEDEEISPRKIGLSEGALEYYKSIGKELYFIYDEIHPFFDGFATVYIEGKGWNFINKQGEYLWNKYEWFDYADDFDEGFARVRIGRKGMNFINTNGNLIWNGKECLGFVGYFYEGFAQVEIEGKWNFINEQGELVWKGNEWFNDVRSFSKGIAEVEYKGDWYKLNTKGELCDMDGNRVNIGLQESKRRVIRLMESDIHNLVIKTLKEYLY